MGRNLKIVVCFDIWYMKRVSAKWNEDGVGKAIKKHHLQAYCKEEDKIWADENGSIRLAGNRDGRRRNLKMVSHLLDSSNSIIESIPKFSSSKMKTWKRYTIDIERREGGIGYHVKILKALWFVLTTKRWNRLWKSVLVQRKPAEKMLWGFSGRPLTNHICRYAYWSYPSNTLWKTSPQEFGFWSLKAGSKTSHSGLVSIFFSVETRKFVLSCNTPVHITLYYLSGVVNLESWFLSCHSEVATWDSFSTIMEDMELFPEFYCKIWDRLDQDGAMCVKPPK